MVLARTVTGLVVILAIPYLQLVALALDAKFVGHPDVFLFTVMVAIPLLCNVGQAWIQDQVGLAQHP